MKKEVWTESFYSGLEQQDCTQRKVRSRAREIDRVPGPDAHVSQGPSQGSRHPNCL